MKARWRWLLLGTIELRTSSMGVESKIFEQPPLVFKRTHKEPRWRTRASGLALTVFLAILCTINLVKAKKGFLVSQDTERIDQLIHLDADPVYEGNLYDFELRAIRPLIIKDVDITAVQLALYAFEETRDRNMTDSVFLTSALLRTMYMRLIPDINPVPFRKVFSWRGPYRNVGRRHAVQQYVISICVIILLLTLLGFPSVSA